MNIRPVLALVALAAAAVPAAADAAPPPNDDRADARPLAPPATVSGSTAGSTLEAGEPSSCEALAGSVHYEIQAPSSRRIVVRLAAQDDLDATVEVFRRTRSQLTAIRCEATDDEGRAALDFRPEKDARYVIRVGQRATSAPGGFSLEVFSPSPPPQPPGPPLPAAGASRALDAIQDSEDAFSRVLRAGVSYRINLANRDEDGCVSLEVYAPGTRDFDDATPLRQVRCGGYLLLTPARGGRYSFRALARSRTTGRQPYHLQVAPAGRDDVGPGQRLPNLQPVHGALDGGRIDVVDLYRFDVVRRSALRLALSGGDGFELLLLDTRGRRLERDDEGTIEREVAPGRYVVVVRALEGASGRYGLTRAARTITRTSIAINGRVHARIAPGQVAQVTVRVRPGEAGPVTIGLERFDPLAGWQFDREIRTSSGAGGTAGYRFVPPTTGRWRATARFQGTRRAASSAAGRATVTVEGPLRAR